MSYSGSAGYRCYVHDRELHMQFMWRKLELLLASTKSNAFAMVLAGSSFLCDLPKQPFRGSLEIIKKIRITKARGFQEVLKNCGGKVRGCSDIWAVDKYSCIR